MRKLKLLMSLLCAAVLLSIAGPAPKVEAGTSTVPIWPTYFPPYVNTGTVIQVEDPEGGPDCILFLDDDGGLFFFSGLDAFAPGTRLLVKGNLCTICLVAPSCGLYASPILNAVAKEI